MSPPSFPTQLAFSPWRGAVPTVPGVPGVVPVVAAASPVTTTPTSVAQEMGLWEPLEPGAFQRIPLLEDTMKNQPTSPRIPRVSSFFFQNRNMPAVFFENPLSFLFFWRRWRPGRCFQEALVSNRPWVTEAIAMGGN